MSTSGVERARVCVQNNELREALDLLMPADAASEELRDTWSLLKRRLVVLETATIRGTATPTDANVVADAILAFARQLSDALAASPTRSDLLVRGPTIAGTPPQSLDRPRLLQLVTTFAYESEQVVDCELELSRGEVVVLVGKNGAGKTTLLRLLAGELAPASRGHRTITGSAPLHVCLVPAPPLLPPMSPRDFLRMVLTAARPDAGVEADVAFYLQWADLDHLSTRSMRSLSLGEQTRVAVAGALACGPDLLLLDEPLAHLDPSGQRALLWMLHQRVHDLAAPPCIVLSTHHLEEAELVATKLLLLKRGRRAREMKPLAPSALVELTALSGGPTTRRTGPRSWSLPTPDGDMVAAVTAARPRDVLSMRRISQAESDLRELDDGTSP